MEQSSKQTVLVTGASRGIGRAIAIEFAKANYNLILTCKRNRDLLEDLRKELSVYPIQCTCFTGDFSNESIFKEFITFIEENHFTIDLLINNAGVSYFGLLQEMSLSDWNNVINTNLTSAFLLSKYVIPQMVSRRHGKIINISSVWGIVGASYEVAYSTSKGALNSFTKALAKELAPSSIQVNAIACGAIDTDMNKCLLEEDLKQLEDSIPVGRMGKPEEVADMVLKIAQSSDYLTGQILSLDGGWI